MNKPQTALECAEKICDNGMLYAKAPCDWEQIDIEQAANIIEAYAQQRCAALVEAQAQPIPIPSGLDDGGLSSFGDDENAQIETDGGQWHVALIETCPDWVDFKEDAPWSALKVAEYFVALHNQNLAALAQFKGEKVDA